jgi:tyrosine-protein kinase Etk/Wzc
MSPLEVRKHSKIQQDGNIINQLLFRYLPYWPLFVIMLAVGLAGAYLFIRYKIPVYEITASVLIKDEKKGTDESKVLEQLNLFSSKKIVENEIEIVKSRSLLKEVVKDLHLYAPIYEEGKVSTIPAFTKSPIDIEIKNPDSLSTDNKVLFSFDKGKQLVTINGKEYPLNQWVPSIWGTIRFSPNKYYQQPDEQKPLYFSMVEIKKVISYLDKQLNITASNKLSTVIEISLKDPVPKRGILIVNDILKQYDRAAVDEKNSLANGTLEFIDTRLALVKNMLDSTDRSIQAYRTTNNIVDVTAQGQQFLQSVGSSDQSLNQIELKLSVLREVEGYVHSKGQTGGITPSTMGIDDPLLASLIQKLYEAQAEYDRLKKTTGENSPILISLRDQINTIKPGIIDNIASQRKNLEASRNNLASSSNRYSSQLRAMPEKERKLVEISRDRQTIAENYAFLLQKREETALSQSATVADSRTVDHAEASDEPVSPNKLLVVLASVIAGLGFAVAIVALKEGLNRNILFRSEIEDYTSIPVIGEIIEDGSNEPIVISHDRKNFIAEQFRQIRTSLSYLGISSRKKKVLITSSIPGEGKSFVAANLAISLALTDKKVVLLEIDLRKPKLSEIFGIKSTSPGISNYFIGEKEADEIIKRTDINPNLFIISAGPIPPNPSELILNGKIQELLAYLENAFDYIVIDTAPVTPVTDAYLLSQFCDATLYVVRHGYTPRIYLQMLEENNKVKGLKNLALIFNGVKSRGIGKGGYGNGYGYGYGVGYDDVGVKKRKSIFGKAYK